jgi:hypothetical protein
MSNQEVIQNPNQDPSGEINIRINDLEEKNNNIREKINLISKNFIILKEDLEERIERIEKDHLIIKNELDKIKRSIINLSEESEKWIRRDEIILIERMLKDFQPIEFIRKKDLKELLLQFKKLNENEASEKNKKPKGLK